MPESSAPVLVAENVSKIFVGQTALDGLSLELHRGRVHALLGENGSGKSTFIKILAGYHQPEPLSRVVVAGDELALGSAAASAAAGMRFVHQDRGLVDGLEIVDNLALVGGYRSRWWVSLRREAREARRILAQFGLDIDVRRRVSDLSAVERSIVAIARALHDFGEHPPRVLVLDEPTESLSKPDMARLFEAVRAAAAAGTAVLYVSHNIDEVLDIADDVSVLKDGHLVATEPAERLDRDRVIELIVGRKLEELAQADSHRESSVALRVTNLSGEIVDDVSFNVGVGEIVGLAGIGGSGRDELPYLLGGARPWDAGTLTLNGATLHRLTVSKALDLGIVFVSSDRAKESAILSMAAHENVTLPGLNRGGILRWMSMRADREEARRWMQHTDVRPCEPARVMTTFSGGNQQKVVLARALRCTPRLLVLDHPVQGVDIGAKFAIYEQLLRVAEEGTSVVVSGDPEDLVEICHRVLIFGGGSISSELHRHALTVERITEHSLASQRNGSP